MWYHPVCSTGLKQTSPSDYKNNGSVDVIPFKPQPNQADQKSIPICGQLDHQRWGRYRR
ncbi:hypothetical protein ACI8B_280046 [Acinetobacter proteolyticus]|uniref:Uncharacterized protein n=1 Tax=Acinetobacter proteolyticus TaxID=1776741 RepID=A0A653K614_9GAMM|nr:hypothetical protein ACI8B_280046 [Acinetobacter proteolyticus]